MSAPICPKGHESTEADFCSECGLKLEDKLPAAGPENCPDCESPREGAEFCEVCGYNYTTGAHGELPAAKPAPPRVPAWKVLITVDGAGRHEDSPEPPAGFAALELELEPGSSLIGRTSAKRAVHPEIALEHDDAVSHRHALLDLHSDGTLWLRDIGSSNGTLRNGREVTPLEDIQLQDGDILTLGHWTRIQVKAEL